MNPYKHKTPIQLRFKDIDKMGHVNNANYLTYFELARTDYFNALTDLKIDWVNEGVILAKIEMEYRQPVLLEDKVFVYTWISKVGSKSFDMSCSVVRIADGSEVEAARGRAVIVCFNYANGQTIEIPGEWRKVLEGAM